MKYFVTVDGSAHEVELEERHGELRVRYDGELLAVRYEEVEREGQVALFVGTGGSAGEGTRVVETSHALSIEGDASRSQVTVAGHRYEVELEDERERAAHDAERKLSPGGGEVKSVMPGVVLKVLVQEGEVVAKDQPLLILEAMKMQNEIASPGPGKVTALHVREGQAVASGARLVSLHAAG